MRTFYVFGKSIAIGHRPILWRSVNEELILSVSWLDKSSLHIFSASDSVVWTDFGHLRVNQICNKKKVRETLEILHCMATEKLFWKDPYQREFTSVVLAKTTRKFEGKTRHAIILQSSLFYGTSGGQPNDTGVITFLDSNTCARVIDVLEESGGTLVHIVDLESMDLVKLQEQVKGEIDWERRFDHTQQHHGQHILSATFLGIANIATLSFHMSKTVSNIDLDCSSLGDELVQRVQLQANQVIVENRKVSSQFYTLLEANKLPLRKKLDPAVEEPVRIIHIEGVDLQACCGTHPRSTSEVQSIVILGSEKVKKIIRVYFICGMRVVKYAFQAAKTLKSIGSKFNVPPDDVERAIGQHLESSAIARKQLTEYEKVVFHHIASDFFKVRTFTSKSSYGLVCAHVADKDIRALKAIAKDDALARQTITALFSEQAPQLENEKVLIHFVMSLSEDIKGIDFREVIKEGLKQFHGKGGGSPGFVQGTIMGVVPVEEVVAYFGQVLRDS